MSHCLLPLPHTADADWRAICRVPSNTTNRINIPQCCTRHKPKCSQGCHKKVASQRASCLQLPQSLLSRGFTLGRQGGVLDDLWHRIGCSGQAGTIPVSIAVAGGSVTAGPGGKSWANHMMQTLQSELAIAGAKHRISLQWGKLATNGVGPAYLSACWDHHSGEWGGKVPDIAVLEYAVNDFGSSMANMEALVRELMSRGTLIVMLHHFTPTFMAGGNGYKGIHNDTGELKHTRLANHYGLSSVSVGEVVGLSRRSAVYRRASERTAGVERHGRDSSARAIERDAMLDPCAFACSFADDLVHPTTCGQRMLGQMASHALRRLLLMHEPPSSSSHRSPSRHCARTGSATSTDAADEPAAAIAKRPCGALPPPISWHEKGGKSGSSARCASVSKCWSNVGPPARWNLKPIDSIGFRLINLKSNSRDVNTKLFKMLWEGRTPGAYAEFAVQCSSEDYQAIRIMHLTGHAIHYGSARIEINGQTVAEPSGHRAKQGSLFISADFPFPRRCPQGRKHVAALFGSSRCPVREHKVRVTVLPSVNTREHNLVGFGINSIMCIRNARVESGTLN